MSTNKSPSSINDDEILKPERKKLKSCEPDLKITVGGAVDGSDAVDYWYHASVMAIHSNYIDTMLASGMKESNTYEVSFPDIPPATWDSMMKFLDKPLAIHLMKVEDVMEVAPWYDKYDFPEGRELSGHILKKYFEVMLNTEIPGDDLDAEIDAEIHGDDLDFFIDAILLVDALHLDDVKNAGVRWIEEVISDAEKLIFSRDHIAKLAPLMAKEDSLFEIVKLFVKSVVTKDDILNRLFPELLVEKMVSSHNAEMLHGLVRGITLSGSGCDEIDGKYNCRLWVNALQFLCYRDVSWGGEEMENFEIIVRDAIWVILGHVWDDEDADEASEKILWKCPHRRTPMLPPIDGWVPVDELARGESPTLKYLMHPEK
jgi:hypothetical protein